MAANNVGIARKNENSVAATRENPNSMPPMMVAPDRDVPGMSASACAHPTFSASVQRMSSIAAMRTVSGRARCRRSAQMMTKAPTTNAHATGTGAKRCALIALLKASPSTPAGTKATTRFSANRCAAGSVNKPRRTATSLARNSQQTARMAPAWITISNVFACSPV